MRSEVKRQVPVGKFKNTSRASNAFCFSFLKLTHLHIFSWYDRSILKSEHSSLPQPKHLGKGKQAYWLVATHSSSEAPMNEHRKASRIELKSAPFAWVHTRLALVIDNGLFFLAIIYIRQFSMSESTCQCQEHQFDLIHCNHTINQTRPIAVVIWKSVLTNLTVQSVQVVLY